MSFLVMGSSNERPMRRLIAKKVRSGLVTAWRLAGWPTSRSPSSVNATIEGVVRAPSEFSMTLGVEPSMTATHELVVPRSMPITFAIVSPNSFREIARPRSGQTTRMTSLGQPGLKSSSDPLCSTSIADDSASAPKPAGRGVYRFRPFGAQGAETADFSSRGREARPRTNAFSFGVPGFYTLR